MLEVRFPDSPPASAAGLVKELRTKLLQNGIPGGTLQIKKSSPDTMDVGTIMQIDWASVLHTAHLSILVVAIVKGLWEVLAPAKASVRITCRDRSIELKPQDIDATKLEALIKSMAEDERQR